MTTFFFCMRTAISSALFLFTSRNWPNLQQNECKQKISKHVDSELYKKARVIPEFPSSVSGAGSTGIPSGLLGRSAVNELALVQNVGLGLVLHQTILSRDLLREIGVQPLDSVSACFPSLCMEQLKE